ncbi:hypothetical protein GQS52_20370 [Streptomyces sp. SCUT-3]|uniref:hypothetical protein n=1 Tax=unclassified Streptomyces TaxID=2593676 RepID=UPI0015F79E14|nr:MULTISPECIES: hypothetical protein [unclassified Streptomyces]MCZ2524512.1 hypothetical protein [Streptomyces sp. HB2AG]QMV23739.1 hypothetical protein GQS52_20370 [Streptomyces sp. SCUT-3]
MTDPTDPTGTTGTTGPRRPAPPRARSRQHPAGRPGWTTGLCWRCEAVDRPVAWAGPVQAHGSHAPMYLCGPCDRRLGELVWAYLCRYARDR